MKSYMDNPPIARWKRFGQWYAFEVRDVWELEQILNSYAIETDSLRVTHMSAVVLSVIFKGTELPKEAEKADGGERNKPEQDIEPR